MMHDPDDLQLTLKQRLHAIGNFRLVFKQPFLSPNSSRISYEIIFCSNYPVTWHHNGNIVFAVCGSCRANCLGITQATRQLDVTNRLSERDSKKLIPNAFLKFGAGLVKRKIKSPSLTMKILDQLFNTVDDHRRQFFFIVGRRFFYRIDEKNLANETISS